MGGPHVTELPDEALGRDGGPRHADAVVSGEADETWLKLCMTLVSDNSRKLINPGVTKKGPTSSQLCNLIQAFRGKP